MPPIDLDPPLQIESRQLLNPYFTSAALARQLIDRFAARGECELTNAFARPRPRWSRGGPSPVLRTLMRWWNFSPRCQDDAVFEDGGTLELSRGQTRNLCFGLGPHDRVGTPLGKLMIRVAFAELLDRVSHLQRDKTVRLTRRDGLSQPFRELRVTFKAR